MPSNLVMPGFPQGGENGVNPEKLYTLWSLVTQHHLSDDARIQAILEKSCALLGVGIALIGEISDGRYLVRHACDPERRFKPGMEMPLALTPCQSVVERRASVFKPDLPHDPALGKLPVIAQLDLQVYLGTPIWDDDKLWGVLAFAGRPSPGPL